jgi:hypothetical protein
VVGAKSGGGCGGGWDCEKEVIISIFIYLVGG